MYSPSTLTVALKCSSSLVMPSIFAISSLAEACSTSASLTRSVVLLVVESFLRGGIEHLLLDRRVHCQQLADALRDRRLFLVFRLLELFEQCGHRPVVLLEQRDCVARRIAAASLSRSCHGELPEIP